MCAALIKTVLFQKKFKKNSKKNQFFKFFFKFIMQLFSADAIVFSKQNMKKAPSKVAHNRPPTFFLWTGPAAQTAQKQKSRTTKSPLMQNWVF